MERYRDAGLPIEERVKDLLSRMTLLEKIKQTDQYFTFDFTKKNAGRTRRRDRMGRYEAVHGQHERGKRSTAWLHAEDRECAAALCSGGNETGHSFFVQRRGAARIL